MDGTGLYFSHGEWLGSASLVTTITGTVVTQQRYLPCGLLRYATGTIETGYRCAGAKQDSCHNHDTNMSPSFTIECAGDVPVQSIISKLFEFELSDFFRPTFGYGTYQERSQLPQRVLFRFPPSIGDEGLGFFEHLIAEQDCSSCEMPALTPFFPYWMPKHIGHAFSLELTGLTRLSLPTTRGPVEDWVFRCRRPRPKEPKFPWEWIEPVKFGMYASDHISKKSSRIELYLLTEVFSPSSWAEAAQQNWLRAIDKVNRIVAILDQQAAIENVTLSLWYKPSQQWLMRDSEWFIATAKHLPNFEVSTGEAEE